MQKRLASTLFALVTIAASFGFAGVTDIEVGMLVTDTSSDGPMLVVAKSDQGVTIRHVNVDNLRAYFIQLNQQAGVVPAANYQIATGPSDNEELFDGEAFEVPFEQVATTTVPLLPGAVEPAGQVPAPAQGADQGPAQQQDDDVAGSGCCGGRFKGWKPNWRGFGAREIVARDAAAPQSGANSNN